MVKKTDFTSLLSFFLISLMPALQAAWVLAGERYYNGGAGGTGVRELPLYIAKDLGIFEKYGLDVELIATNGGSPLVQALVGGSIQSASVAAMAPIRAISAGANLAIVAGFLNKNMTRACCPCGVARFQPLMMGDTLSLKYSCILAAAR